MVSVDEIMVRFTGRSSNKIRIKGKPIPEGYKILSLCQYGYCFGFLLCGTGDDKYFGIEQEHSQSVDGEYIPLSPTSRAVLYLCLQLPLHIRRFCMFCDNFFSNIRLFAVLREYGIAACGTVRSNSAEYPDEHKGVDKRKHQLPYNYISATSRRNVLSFLWQDRTLVRFLTTAYTATDWCEVQRKRPNPYTRQLREFVQEFWGDNPTAMLQHSRAAVDYNNYMGGVDIHDQRHSYYKTQLTTVRNWLPLFFWALDATIVNCHMICRVVFQGIKNNPVIQESRNFRIRLAWNLVVLEAV